MPDQVHPHPHTHERRAAVRETPTDKPWLGTARIRPGREVKVIDFSSLGALVEGTFRIPPGSSVSIKFALLSDATAVTARVVRSYVHSLDPEQGAIYRAALEFDRPVELPEDFPGDRAGNTAATAL